MKIRIVLLAIALASPHATHAQDREKARGRIMSQGNMVAVCPSGYVASGLECRDECETRDLQCIKYPAKYQGPSQSKLVKEKQGEISVGTFVTGIMENESGLILISFTKSSVEKSEDCRKTLPGEKECRSERYLAGLQCDEEGCLRPILVCCPAEIPELPNEESEANDETE